MMAMRIPSEAGGKSAPVRTSLFNARRDHGAMRFTTILLLIGLLCSVLYAVAVARGEREAKNRGRAGDESEEPDKNWKEVWGWD
jgi:hypothetical protein